MSTTALDILAIGRAVSAIQQPPERIRAAALELNIAPAMIINRIPHFHSADIDLIAEHLHQQNPKEAR